jgi:hypothetical protein
VRWEGFDASHDSWVSRRDITPKALSSYEKFFRLGTPQADRPRSGRGYSAAQQGAFRKKLESFVGVNGQYSVINHADSRRTPKVSVCRGEREEAGARHDGVEAPNALIADSDSASDNNPAVTAGDRRSRKPPGFYRE